MAHHLTTAEVENKVAFLVQLNALLTQVDAVVGCSTQKARLGDVRKATEMWLKDLEDVGASRPSLATTTPTTAAEAVDGRAATNTTGVIRKETSTETSTPATEALMRVSTSPSACGAPSSFTAVSCSTAHVLAANRSLTDLVGYLRLLFNGDVPERAKLQSFGRNLARLLMVRCCSTIMSSLQHVAHHSYNATSAAASEGCRDELPEGNSGAAEKERTENFISLARNINAATTALVGTVQLVTASAVVSDASSSRFPVQLCADVVKQTRRALVYFASRLEKEELFLLREHLFQLPSSGDGEPSDCSLDNVDAAQDVLSTKSPEQIAAHVDGRVRNLQRLWGPSLVHSIRNIGDVVGPSVAFLTAVAAVRAEGAPAPLVALKKDAAHDLFSLCGPLGGSRTTSLTKPPSLGNISTVVASPVSVSSTTPPAWRALAAEVSVLLGNSFLADYLAAVAGCCGDGNEGQLLATRLLTDLLKHLVAHDLPLLRCVLRDRRWSRPLYDGILNCVLSTQPAVLAAGLDTLSLLFTTCPMELGQEVGFLYSNVVLRLLESSNSPQYVKRTIVLHFLTTFVNSSSGTVAEKGLGGPVPLLLYLYRIYDLNVHAHQLNFVQQLISALSRIVRAAPKEDFVLDATLQEQPRPQADAHIPNAASTGTSEAARAPHSENTVGGGEDGTTIFEQSSFAAPAAGTTAATTSLSKLASLSLPSMALHGLCCIVELVATQTPPDDEGGQDMLAQLPPMPYRDMKLKEQHEADRFNASPKQTIYSIFHVGEENTIPASHAAFSQGWDHTLLPPPASAAAVQKVNDAVDFLTCISSLDPEAVAEFLTTPSVFPLQVCAAYLRRLPLAGYSLLEAIAELLMRVQLPKEGQRIERLLEYFSAAYYEANSGNGIDSDVFPFKSDTAVFIVVVATVMLNTNIHNPSAGTQLDLKTFRGQLRQCNEEEDFANSFVDNIFFRISAHPLKSINGVALGSTAVAENSTRSAFDSFFVSVEERRQLAFGVERQRMMSETRQLLQLRTKQSQQHEPCSSAWWCAAAKELFLSTWSSVCAVFGPAMYEGVTTAPLDVLLPCVRGLQSLLRIAAAFNLPTECTVTLITLLRMAEGTPVRAQCRRAVLIVAATTHAMNFPVRCWVAVCQLMLELRRTATAAAPPLVEDVFTRLEGITRLSVEAEEKHVAAATTSSSPSVEPSSNADGVDGTPGANHPTTAIRCALEGIMMTIRGYAVGDVASLAAALAVLRRALEYTRIVHLKRGTDVVYFVNVRDFTHVVVPAYVELLQKHCASDDGLQVLFECIADILYTMWVSDSTRAVATQTAVDSTEGASMHSWTVDAVTAGVVESFSCLRRIHDATLTATSDADGAFTLLQMHALQAVKEILSRTVRAAEVTSAGQRLSLYTMVASWQQVLYPLAMSLCDHQGTSTEAGSLALLVLRKLVALCGGTGGISSSRLPVPVRRAVLWLLAQLAYMGGMCGDVDSSQLCVALLSSICTVALTIPSVTAPPSLKGRGTPITTADARTHARLEENRDVAVQHVVASLETNNDYLVERTFALMCLLLRCEREQTRSELMHQLRTLALQMQPVRFPALVLDLAEVVLEGTIGHAGHHQTPITHPSLLPFLLLQMPVPPSMRRCSRSSFRVTLPAVLAFLSNEVLTGLEGEDLATVAESVMRYCLMPIFLSPNSAHQAKLLAVRSLAQCIAVCLPQGSAPPCQRVAQCILDCLSIVLYTVQIPLDVLVAPTASFVGRRWWAASTPCTASLCADYSSEATRTVALMSHAEPRWLVWGTAVTETREDTVNVVDAMGSTPDADMGPATIAESQRGTDALMRSEGRPRSCSGARTSDEFLVEYITIVAQVFAGFPKELREVMASAAGRGEDRNDASASSGGGKNENGEGWRLPRTSAPVLTQLTLQVASTLFTVLWRINHPLEVERYALQSAELGGAALASTRSSGLQPHVAVLSVLQCYLDLAMFSPEYPSAELLAVTTDIIDAIRQLQQVTHPSASTPSSAPLHLTDAASSLSASASSLQRLSPQEQQHVRTCNAGMYQQLAAFLGSFVRLLTRQSTPSPLPEGWVQRRKCIEKAALDQQFFSSLVSLLTPTAGSLVVTVRDYLEWYITQMQLHDVGMVLVRASDGAAPSYRTSSSDHCTAAGKAITGNGEAHDSNGVDDGESIEYTNVIGPHRK